jgi:hypothetical protein
LAEAAAQMHLKTFGVTAVAVLHYVAGETNVGELDAGTRIGAAVDVDRDRHIQPRVDVFQAAIHLNSIPLQAFRFRRRCDGVDGNPSASSPATSSSTRWSGTSSTISFW